MPPKGPEAVTTRRRRTDESLAELHAHLLARWRVSRHPRIGDLCERIAAARLAEAPRPSLPATKKRADLALWMEVADSKDPLDVPRLAAAARAGSQDDVAAHVEKLAVRCDPTMATAMLALLEHPPYAGVKSRGLLASIFEAIAETRDTRAAEPIRALGLRYLTIVNSGTGGWVSLKLAALADVLRATPIAALNDDDAALCDELEARFGKREVAAPPAGAKTLEELLSEVYKAPDDDGPRQVIADALIEQGDPRGEWIALDLARARGELDAAGKERQQALATPGQLATWAHPLANGGKVSFERGFPARLRLYRNAKALLGARELATIHTITDLENVSQKSALALLDSMGSLRAVSTFSEKVLDACCTRPRPWLAIGLAIEKAMPSAQALANLPALTALAIAIAREAVISRGLDLPGLPSLEVSTAEFALLPDLGLSRLTSLRSLQLRFGRAEQLALPDSLETLVVQARELPIPSGGSAVASIELRAPSITRAHLAPLASARTVKVYADNPALEDFFEGFALEELELWTEGYHERLLADQHGLRRLRALMFPEHVPEAPLEDVRLEFPGQSETVVEAVAELVTRTPTLRRLELDANRLDAAKVAQHWTARLPEQLEHFSLEFSPSELGAIGKIELTRDSQTRRWSCQRSGCFDPVGRAVLAAFEVPLPTDLESDEEDEPSDE